MTNCEASLRAEIHVSARGASRAGALLGNRPTREGGPFFVIGRSTPGHGLATCAHSPKSCARTSHKLLCLPVHTHSAVAAAHHYRFVAPPQSSPAPAAWAALEAVDAEDARTSPTRKMPFTGQWAVLRPVDLKAALHIASSNNLPASASPWISQLREKVLPWPLVPW